MKCPLQIGTILRTNYKTGPYILKKVFGPCDCPEYLDSLGRMWNNPAPRSKLHFHFTLTGMDGKGEYYLGGFEFVGDRILSVWGSDELFIEGIKPGTPLQLIF